LSTVVTYDYSAWLAARPTDPLRAPHPARPARPTGPGKRARGEEGIVYSEIPQYSVTEGITA
jgi:hypothetical protein